MEGQSTKELTWQAVHKQSFRLLQLALASEIDEQEEAADAEIISAEQRATNAVASTSAGGYSGSVRPDLRSDKLAILAKLQPSILEALQEECGLFQAGQVRRVWCIM